MCHQLCLEAFLKRKYISNKTIALRVLLLRSYKSDVYRQSLTLVRGATNTESRRLPTASVLVAHGGASLSMREKTALLHPSASKHSHCYKNLCKFTQINLKIFLLAHVLRKVGKDENPGFGWETGILNIPCLICIEEQLCCVRLLPNLIKR